MSIGFIGLGAMGGRMVKRLSEMGYDDLVLFDVNRSRLEEFGPFGRPASSIAALAAYVDTVFTVLPADQHLLAVAAELEKAGRPGQVLAECSTVLPATIDQVARRVGTVGMETLGVGITRGTSAAETGDLLLFAGPSGPAARLGTVLDSLASDIRESATAGVAKALKIANNMLLASLNILVSEAIVLGRVFGIDPPILVNHLAGSGAGSWALDHQIVPHVLGEDLGPGRFSVVLMAKDQDLFLDLAAGVSQPVWFTPVAAATYRGVMTLGFGEHYHPVVIRWLEHVAGDVIAADLEKRWPESHALETIGSGVRAAQSLACVEALRVLGKLGIQGSEAAAQLRGASGDNEALHDVGAYLDDEAAALPDQDALGSVTKTIELASLARVPAFMLEAARQVALSL